MRLENKNDLSVLRGITPFELIKTEVDEILCENLIPHINIMGKFIEHTNYKNIITIDVSKLLDLEHSFQKIL